MQLHNLFFLLLLIVFCQCKKGDTEKPGTSAAEQVKRDHGQLTGVATKQTIGAAGEVFHADWCNHQHQMTVSGTFKIRKNY